MAFTTFLRNELLDHAFRNSAYTPPATVYIGLYTSATGAGGTGTEVSGNGYTRKAMAFDASVSGAIDNTAAVEFPTATGTWGTVSHIGIYDASTAGNLLAYAALTTSKSIASGDVFRIPTGDIDITLD